MPAFIRTPKDEARWEKAKEAANKTRSEADGDIYWGLVNHIYQKMKKSEFEAEGNEAIVQRIELIKDLIVSSGDLFKFKPEILDKTVEALLKARGDDDEEDQDYDLQDYGDDPQLGEEDLEGLRVTDDPFEDEDDEASKWLREHGEVQGDVQEASGDDEKASSEKKAPSEEVKPKSSSGYSDWKPHGEYTPEQQKAMEDFKSQGYSDREAERLAGAHRMPKDFQSALSHTVRPSQPSNKMLEEMKGLAGHWLDRADRHAKINANPEKNPQKFASGKMMQAHEAGTKDYSKAYNDFLASDELKSKKGLDRHKAIQAWKQDWKNQNPDYHEKLVGGMDEARKNYGEAQQARSKNLNETLMHIMTGGQQEGAMSAQEAAQHVGGTKTDEGYSSTIIKDPSASFAQANPQLVEKLRSKLQPEQFDRFQRVQSARAAQGVGGTPKPKVIRRPGGAGSSGQGVS